MNFEETQRNAEIVQRHRAGEGKRTLARVYGLSIVRIKQIINRADFQESQKKK